jgi:hypothetical protein
MPTGLQAYIQALFLCILDTGTPEIEARVSVGCQ